MIDLVAFSGPIEAIKNAGRLDQEVRMASTSVKAEKDPSCCYWDHRSSTAASIPLRSPSLCSGDELPGAFVRQFTVCDNNDTIDNDVIETLGVLMRLRECSLVRHGFRIK